MKTCETSGRPQADLAGLGVGEVRGQRARPRHAAVAGLEHQLGLHARLGQEARGLAGPLADERAAQRGQAIAPEHQHARGAGPGGSAGTSASQKAAPARQRSGHERLAAVGVRAGARGGVASASCRTGPSRSAPRSRGRAGRRPPGRRARRCSARRPRRRQQLVDRRHALDHMARQRGVREAHPAAVQDRVERGHAARVRGGHQHQAPDAAGAGPGHRRRRARRCRSAGSSGRSGRPCCEPRGSRAARAGRARPPASRARRGAAARTPRGRAASRR